MLKFNNKLFNYITAIVFFYLLYDLYKHYPKSNVPYEAYKSSKALISIDIDPSKKYSDYTMSEKLFYNLYRDKIDSKLDTLNKNNSITKTKHNIDNDNISLDIVGYDSIVLVEYELENSNIIKEITLNMSGDSSIEQYPNLPLKDYIIGKKVGEVVNISFPLNKEFNNSNEEDKSKRFIKVKIKKIID